MRFRKFDKPTLVATVGVRYAHLFLSCELIVTGDNKISIVNIS